MLFFNGKAYEDLRDIEDAMRAQGIVKAAVNLGGRHEFTYDLMDPLRGWHIL